MSGSAYVENSWEVFTQSSLSNPNETGNLFHYFTQGACATEVEVDTLTGDHTVLRVDINMDVGKSLNPAIDYGQMYVRDLLPSLFAKSVLAARVPSRKDKDYALLKRACGCARTVQSLQPVQVHRPISFFLNRTFLTSKAGAYKLPGFSDIPQTFNVSLLRDAEWPNLGSIKASKGVGEPPLFLGCSVALAIRYALKSARADAGEHELQDFRLPLTSERIRLACKDFLVEKGRVEAKDGQQDFFVHI